MFEGILTSTHEQPLQ